MTFYGLKKNYPNFHSEYIFFLFKMFQFPFINKIQKYTNNYKMHFNIILCILFTIFVPTYFERYSHHLQSGVPITRI